ncbi:hypothetical protein [Chryseobacterium sp. POE27]|uniref:hypothetical protein n=1 Tax=Chryseobacterium sp. POE27 TaxID=3138177 RepID=UPI003218FEE1
MKSLNNKRNCVNIDRLKYLIISTTIEKDKTIDKLVGGFSQSLSKGIEDTISDGQSNNCDGVNCRKYCAGDIYS